MSPLFISKGGDYMVNLQDMINLATLIVNIIAVTAMLIKKY